MSDEIDAPDDQAAPHARRIDALDRERNVAIMIDALERDRVRDVAWSTRTGPAYVRLKPPNAWSHPDTGRRELEPDPLLVMFGRYLRRARALAGFSQRGLGYRGHVSQSMISRAERGLAPAMGLEPVARLGAALGRALPLGFCPHDHRCSWQPIKPRLDEKTEIERLVDLMLGHSTDDEAQG